MSAKNSLQAVMDRQTKQAANTEQPPSVVPTREPGEGPASRAKFSRPVREGRKFIGGHFTPEVAKQLRLIAAEEGTTTQALLEDALELLFIKKGKGSLQRV